MVEWLTLLLRAMFVSVSKAFVAARDRPAALVRRQLGRATEHGTGQDGNEHPKRWGLWTPRHHSSPFEHPRRLRHGGRPARHGSWRVCGPRWYGQ